MRFLHTADWHLGKLIRGRSRTSEQEAVLSEILGIAREGQIDCLLLGGDLFDSHAPSPDAERLAFHFFGELIGRGVPAVVIGGNHDHPRRLAALRELTEALSIFVRPEPAPPDRGGIVEIVRNGQKALVATLPFVPERKVTTALDLIGPEEELYSSYEDGIASISASLSARFEEDTVNVFLAHLFFRGARTSGSERAVHVAKPYEISARKFPPGAQYIALGHLHRPQEVAARAAAWYAGSPLQLDFGEQLQEKRVILVEITPGKQASVEPVPLASGRKLRDIQGTLEELTVQAPSLGDDYLRVTVFLDAPLPGIAERVRAILPGAVDIRIDYPRETAIESHSEFRKLSPEALFSEFHRSLHGQPPPEALAGLFVRLYQEASDETD